jgi:hypothetical protein
MRFLAPDLVHFDPATYLTNQQALKMRSGCQIIVKRFLLDGDNCDAYRQTNAVRKVTEARFGVLRQSPAV